MQLNVQHGVGDVLVWLLARLPSQGTESPPEPVQLVPPPQPRTKPLRPKKTPLNADCALLAALALASAVTPPLAMPSQMPAPVHAYVRRTQLDAYTDKHALITWPQPLNITIDYFELYLQLNNYAATPVTFTHDSTPLITDFIYLSLLARVLLSSASDGEAHS